MYFDISAHTYSRHLFLQQFTGKISLLRSQFNMMMSKPKSEATSSTSTTSSALPTASTTSNPADAVADLERRLADLSAATPIIPQSAVSMSTAIQQTSTPAMTAQTTSNPSATSSKNALLVSTIGLYNRLSRSIYSITNVFIICWKQARIIAAQERAKQAQPIQPATLMTPPSFDFLSTPAVSNEHAVPPPFSSPPSFESMMANTVPSQSFAPPSADLPPPVFNDAIFSPPPVVNQQPSPPAFDSSFLPPPTYTQNNSSNSTQFAAMHASAPFFEDLMMEPNHPPALLPPPVPPPSMSNATNCGGLDDEAIQAILAIEGLSQADKDELINEQLKIMKSIEGSKKSAQVSAADAFEQRSFSAAVQAVGGGSNRNAAPSSSVLGKERTQKAIADGTAVVVQCTACGEWMQVTGAAQFMMCSSCNTMTQVQETGITSEEAQQMIDDAKLAEQLQKEEYEEADRAVASSARNSPSRTTPSSSSTSNTKAASSGTWMEWLGFGTPAPAPATRASNDLQLSYSRDSADDAADGLLGSSSSQRRQGARVVSQQPLFACVTDSISSAANYAINSAQGLNEDEEGNVHGVDSSSLLAVTQAGRGSSNQSYEQMPGNGGPN